MDDLAIQQPRDRLQSHVRMGRDIQRRADLEGEWPEPIEKAPGSDQPSAFDRQRAENAQVSDPDVTSRVRFELLLWGSDRDALFGGNERIAHPAMIRLAFVTRRDLVRELHDLARLRLTEVARLFDLRASTHRWRGACPRQERHRSGVAAVCRLRGETKIPAECPHNGHSAGLGDDMPW